MGGDNVSFLLYSLDLLLSSQDDHKILIFFGKELNKIRKNHNFLLSWYSKSDMAVLIKLANKLWVYIDTVTHFISDLNLSRLTSQLNLVLNLTKELY